MTDIEVKKEYVERLEGNFKKVNPYTYGTKVWDSIKAKYDELVIKINEIPYVEEKEIRIDGEDYLIEFEEFVKKQTKLTSKVEGREAVLAKLRELNWKISSISGSVWKRIKFIFSIPALAFASFVFSYIIILIFSIPLNLIFPTGFSDEYSGLTESILAAIIFVVLKTVLILDAHDRYLEENWIAYILKYLLMICIYWTIFYAIRYSTYEVIYQFNYFQWMIYLPFLWLGGIVHEFFRAGLIGYFIVTLLPILIALPIILYREFGIKLINKKNKEYFSNNEEVQDDSYNYHFNEEIELKELGQDNNQDNSQDNSLDNQINNQIDK